MAWCRQATSHYLNQCWPRSMPPYGITRPQRVKGNHLYPKNCWKTAGLLCGHCSACRWIPSSCTHPPTPCMDMRVGYVAHTPSHTGSAPQAFTPWRRENIPVTQTTPKPTLLIWGGCPHHKNFPHPWPSCQTWSYHAYQATQTTPTPLCSWTLWCHPLIIRCTTNAKFAWDFIGY